MVIANITVCNLDNDVNKRLQMRATDNGRSTKKKVRLTPRDAFDDRVLQFDSEALHTCTDIVSICRAAGQAVAQADCKIATIAFSREMMVATHSVSDFEGNGAEVVDPWTAA